MSHPRRTLALLRLTLLVGILPANAIALAGKPKGAKVSAAKPSVHRGSTNHAVGAGHRNAMANQNNGPVIQNLHSTLQVLAQSQHDYQGHRVRAMQDIGTAIHHLQNPNGGRIQSNPASSYVPNRNGNGAASKNSVPQAVSDQRLRTAMQSLNEIGTFISNNGFAPNHARALASVQKAAQELNTALAIR